jgi:hypothetical protein
MRVQRDDVRQTRQPTCFQFSGELRHDVEAAALRGTVESAGERASTSSLPVPGKPHDCPTPAGRV